MRDDAYLDDQTESTTRSSLTRALGAGAGAVVSLALLAGVVVWAYKLGSQDAREVPVIRAAEGPTRIAPEEPGGVRFEHQGLAVYESISGREEGGRIARAPDAERPAADDRPMVSMTEPGGIAPFNQAADPEITSLGSVEPTPESPAATARPEPLEGGGGAQAETPQKPESEIETTVWVDVDR